MLVVVVDGLAEFVAIDVAEELVAVVGTNPEERDLDMCMSTLAAMSWSREKLLAEQKPWNSKSWLGASATGSP